MKSFLRRTVLGAAAGGLLIALAASGSAQAGDVPADITPVGHWHLSAIQIKGSAPQACPVAPTFSPFWYCDDDNYLELKANGKFKADLPTMSTTKGTWFWNHDNVVVFNDADDYEGADAQAYGLKLKAAKMRVSKWQPLPDGSHILVYLIFERVE